MTITFTVPGKPQGKGRPRASRDGHMYTPKKTREYESLIKRCYMLQHREKFEGCVMLRITALYPVPRSAKKSDREKMLRGLILPKKKPDGDNIEKAVADALNGVAYNDDRQIVSCTWKKEYTLPEKAGLIISITEVVIHDD